MLLCGLIIAYKNVIMCSWPTEASAPQVLSLKPFSLQLTVLEAVVVEASVNRTLVVGGHSKAFSINFTVSYPFDLYTGTGMATLVEALHIYMSSQDMLSSSGTTGTN